MQQLLDRTDAQVHALDVLPFAERPAHEALRVTELSIDLARRDLASVLASTGALPPGKAVDLLVCNAGINIAGRLTALTDADVAKPVAVNLASVIVLVQKCLAHNAALGAPPPSMVLISSLSHHLSYPGAALYGATKEGLVSLAKALRVVSGAHGGHEGCSC